MKKFWLSSSWSFDVKKGNVNEEKSEDLTRKVIHEKDVKKTNVATNRAYRAYKQVRSDTHEAYRHSPTPNSWGAFQV